MLNKTLLAIGLASIATFAGAAPVFNPANGHWYDFISGQVTFADALAGAAGAGAVPIAGFQSHLATVTSDAENDFIVNSVTSELAWLAGSDAAVEGTWVWVAGPETGQAFVYDNWNVGEPNDLGGEDALQINWFVPGGWNDVSGFFVGSSNGYVVEYEPLSTSGAVPEPSTWMTMLIGFGAIGLAMRSGRRTQPSAIS